MSFLLWHTTFTTSTLQISTSEVFLQFTLELAVTDELLTHYVTKFGSIENKWRKHNMLWFCYMIITTNKQHIVLYLVVLHENILLYTTTAMLYLWYMLYY